MTRNRERLNRERQKWEQQHKADIALAKALRRIHAGSKDDEIIQEATERKAETLGWTPEQMRYAIGNPATETAPAASAPEGAEQPDETRALVNRIIEETPALKESSPIRPGSVHTRYAKGRRGYAHTRAVACAGV